MVAWSHEAPDFLVSCANHPMLRPRIVQDAHLHDMELGGVV